MRQLDSGSFSRGRRALPRILILCAVMALPLATTPLAESEQAPRIDADRDASIGAVLAREYQHQMASVVGAQSAPSQARSSSDSDLLALARARELETGKLAVEIRTLELQRDHLEASESGGSIEDIRAELSRSIEELERLRSARTDQPPYGASGTEEVEQ